MARERTRPKSEAVPERGLTGKQLAFVEAYVGPARFNGTRAAREAGYSGSHGVLRVVASENLAKPNIRAEIERRLKGRHLTADVVLSEYAEIAVGGARDFVVIDDKGKASIDWARLKESGRLSAVKKVHFDESGNITALDWYDKQEALDKIGKALGLWDRPPDSAGTDNPLVEALRKIAGAGKKG